MSDKPTLAGANLTGTLIIDNWIDISLHPIPKDDYEDPASPVLVSNGVRVGEAQLRTDYGAWDGEEEQVPWRWAWTHHSTCSCCHSFMEPQPTHYQPLPKGPSDARSEDPAAAD